MCKLFISEDGTFIAPAIIRVPAINFVAPVLRDNELVAAIKPIEQNVSFLVDTGADVTCISSLDADRLEIETRFLRPAEDVIGIGGRCRTFKLTDIEIGLIDKLTEDRIWFHIEQLQYVYVMDEKGLKMPSLLGIDMLRRFDISTNRKRRTANLKRIATVPGEFRIVSRALRSMLKLSADVKNEVA